MRLKVAVVILMVLLAQTLVACRHTSGLNFPPQTTRNVIAPAPVPWPNVRTFTEQTYIIKVNVNEQFAIGMEATDNLKFTESNNGEYISKIDENMVAYSPNGTTWTEPLPSGVTDIPPNTLTAYGTDWFLFKAIKSGTTEIVFQYPLEYTKLFKIIIH